MKQLKKYLFLYKSDLNGATAIEYGLILAGLAVFLVIIIFTMGDNLVAMFTALDTEIQTHSSSATPAP